jgi:hypothetical protein
MPITWQNFVGSKLTAACQADGSSGPIEQTQGEQTQDCTATA